MYESHFGFTASPFQLNPDPAFYFDSRGHSNALAYLKFGAHQGEGFIVVTGEIGAGKTTLVRTLLGGLDPNKVVAAQVVSTQLESSELLQSILLAFGVAASKTSKAHLIASLEAFLTGLAAKGRRALLIIDEAQNLKHEAVEELRMLSNFQLGNYGLLQSFLVGQPELRGLLQSKSMEQLRQRVIASCHLGPLDPIETRGYVEHRMRRVGWNGKSPAFEADALDRIHPWTGGVPRRINRLCNRLLLGAFLANAKSISAAMIEETALELKGEIGEAVPTLGEIQVAPPLLDPPPVDMVASPKVEVIAPEPASTNVQQTQGTPQPGNARPRRSAVRKVASAQGKSGPTAAGPQQAARDRQASGTPVAAGKPISKPPVATRRLHREVALSHPVICLVDSAVDYLKAGLLSSVFEGIPSLPPVVAVHVGSVADLEPRDLDALSMPLPALGVNLGIEPGSFAARVSRMLPAFDALLTEFQPRAVLVMGSTDADLTCSLLARKRGFPLLRTVSGQRDTAQEIGAGSNAILIDKNADVLYTDSMETFYALYREGVRLDRVHSVGNLGRELLDMLLARGHVGRSATGLLSGVDPSDLNATHRFIGIDPGCTDTPAGIGDALLGAHSDAKLRALIGTEALDAQTPQYWDAGTANRIARHLVDWFAAPRRDTKTSDVDAALPLSTP